ncbi:MAG: cysteine synthase family protein [Isosphaeraceae bacterium]|nr:cysteine synthase family protein [Isosphaeraceae bacterium]
MNAQPAALEPDATSALDGPRGGPPPLAGSILDVIGNTPLVELRQVVRRRGLEGRILAKLEYLNPGSSKKDRVALEIVRRARADGRLRPGQAVVEVTSGNTGTGLAIVCAALGHPFVAVMSRGNTVERARQMAAFGAEVVLVDQGPGGVSGQVSGSDMNLVEEEARRLVAERSAFRAYQFESDDNCRAHERHTGPELWEQSEGQIDAFAMIAGTCGTYTGVMRYLRRVNPSVRGYLIEPARAAVLAGVCVDDPRHKIQGTGYGRHDLPLLDRALVNEFLQVDDPEAAELTRALAIEEGIFAGISTGANLAVALRLLAGPERGNTIAIIVCDSGLKYLSTDLYP